MSSKSETWNAFEENFVLYRYMKTEYHDRQAFIILLYF